jgi:hypothetical protein
MIMDIMNYSHDEPISELVRWFEGDMGKPRPLNLSLFVGA